MFERLKFLYSEKMITDAHLKVAVSKKWITQEQMDEIVVVK